MIRSKAPKEFLITLNMARVSGKTFTSLIILITLTILNMVSKSEFTNKLSGTKETIINVMSIIFQMFFKKEITLFLASHLIIISAIKSMIHTS